MIIQGFHDAGISIEVVSGNSWERKKWIQNASKRQELLRSLDWLYIESSTMPMALTDPDHLPRHPTMDAEFWKRLRATGVPVGLFYRDVHWRFSQYAQVPLIKRGVALAFYHLEWAQIERSVDHLFLPSEKMNEALLRPWPTERLSALPPGCSLEDTEAISWNPNRQRISLLYVGGIAPPLYDIRPLFSVAAKVPMVNVTVCCRKDEWERYAAIYRPLQTDNIAITHRSGNELNDLYKQSDAVAILRRGSPYLEFAMPVKLFEAMGWGKPIITNDGTAAADFVRAEGIGWVTHSEEELVALLKRLIAQPELLSRIQKRVNDVRARHTWQRRAETIASVLMSYKLR